MSKLTKYVKPEVTYNTQSVGSKRLVYKEPWYILSNSSKIWVRRGWYSFCFFSYPLYVCAQTYRYWGVDWRAEMEKEEQKRKLEEELLGPPR
ncbi:hypothetical protein Ddc_02034 [Ditylenchus destructor]|nr:hypothetical protein Ddc_02034 [Ditylenchus destructor]